MVFLGRHERLMDQLVAHSSRNLADGVEMLKDAFPAGVLNR